MVDDHEDYSQPFSVVSLPLPTGAATEATLATLSTDVRLELCRLLLASLNGKDFATQTTLSALLTELKLKSDLTETQPVSAASLPLPTGAATSAKQDTMITALQLIDDLRAALASVATDKILIGPAANIDPIPVGKIPNGATQVAKYKSASNGTEIVHTVTEGKTLYISHIDFSGVNDAAATMITYLFMRNDLDVDQYYLFSVAIRAGETICQSGGFLPPIEVPEDWDICIISLDASFYVRAFIHGYEM